MLTSSALLAPHLPTLVEDQHRGHATPMLVALEALSQRLLAEAPQAVVALSTRWNAPGPFRVDAGRRHRTLTDYTGMGVVVRYDCNGQPALARAIVEAAQRANLSAGSATRGVDSGVSVPLHFLVPDRRLPVVPLSLPHRPAAECRQWGALLRRVLEAWPERVLFVVGGVLSYNLHAMNLRLVQSFRPGVTRCQLQRAFRSRVSRRSTTSRRSTARCRTCRPARARDSSRPTRRC